jgi:hypothetical protein
MNVTFSISPTTTRRILLLTTTTALLLAGGMAYAGLVPFTAGQPLKASDLAGNFKDLDDRVKGLESAGTKPVFDLDGDPGTTQDRFSIAAVYRDSTTAVKGALALKGKDGYVAGKIMCEDLLKSDSAHMCTSIELVRSEQLGVSIKTSGWYSTGAWTQDPAGPAFASDCGRWLDGTATRLGPYWESPGRGPLAAGCDTLHQVLCCD